MKDSAFIAGFVSAGAAVVILTFVGDLPAAKRIVASLAIGASASVIAMTPELLNPEWKTALLSKSGGLSNRISLAERSLRQLGDREQALLLAVTNLGNEVQSVTNRCIALKGQGASTHTEWFATVSEGLTLLENYLTLRRLPDAPDDVAASDVAALVKGLIQQAKGVKSEQVSEQLIALQTQIEMIRSSNGDSES
jgi:hypothetical protein